MPCTMYIVINRHCIVHIVQCTLYTTSVQCTVSISSTQCTLYSVQCISRVHNVHCTVYTLSIIRWRVYNYISGVYYTAQCTMYSTCAVHSVQCTLNRGRRGQVQRVGASYIVPGADLSMLPWYYVKSPFFLFHTKAPLETMSYINLL